MIKLLQVIQSAHRARQVWYLTVQLDILLEMKFSLALELGKALQQLGRWVIYPDQERSFSALAKYK